MQRMLVGLVVVLTAAVGALGVATINLYLDAEGTSGQRHAAQPRAPVGEAVDVTRLSLLEERLAALRDENETLTKRQQEMDRLLARLRAEAHSGGVATKAGRTPEERTGGSLADPNRPRDADGGFVITDEDEAYFMELQKRIKNRQRVDGLTRNAMNRLGRLGRTGEIAEVAEDKRDAVEAVVRRYVVANDALVTHYFRSGTDEMKALSADEKRARLQEERDALATELQRDLEPMLGAADATTASESVLTTSWGLRNTARGRGRFRSTPRR